MSPARRIDIPAMVSVIIIGGFFVAFFMDPADATFRGAMVTAFAAAWGFWLGSSRGAHENREALNRMAERAGHSLGSVTVEAPASISVETTETRS